VLSLLKTSEPEDFHVPVFTEAEIFLLLANKALKNNENSITTLAIKTAQKL
jgi:hypothetical protein